MNWEIFFCCLGIPISVIFFLFLTEKEYNKIFCDICGEPLNNDMLSKKYGNWCSNEKCGIVPRRESSYNIPY